MKYTILLFCLITTLNAYSQANGPDEKNANAPELIYEDIDESDIVAFDEVDTIPRSQDCRAKLKHEKLKKCVSMSIMKLVQRKFNTELAGTLGLTGRQKIVTKFVINDQGKVVNITSEASHPALADEAIRVVNLIPDLVPATQDGKTVAVKYSFPIVFQIQD